MTKLKVQVVVVGVVEEAQVLSLMRRFGVVRVVQALKAYAVEVVVASLMYWRMG